MVTFEPLPKAESVAPATRPQNKRRKRKGVDYREENDIDNDNEESDRLAREGFSISAATNAETAITSISAIQDEETVMAVKTEEVDDDQDIFLHPFPAMPKPTFMQEADDEEEKPEGKPTLRVSYTGFS